MGGLIAIEVARQLAHSGRKPLYVGAIDSGFALPNASEKMSVDEKDADCLPWEALLADMREPNGITKPIEHLYQQYARQSAVPLGLWRTGAEPFGGAVGGGYRAVVVE